MIGVLSVTSCYAALPPPSPDLGLVGIDPHLPYVGSGARREHLLHYDPVCIIHTLLFVMNTLKRRRQR